MFYLFVLLLSILVTMMFKIKFHVEIAMLLTVVFKRHLFHAGTMSSCLS